MILNRKYYVAIAFLPRHQWGKLDLPKAFICISFLSSDTKDPPSIFLEARLLQVYMAAEKLGTQGIKLHQRFPANEETLCEFIKLFSVTIVLR